METRKSRGSGFIFYIILIAIIFVVVFAIMQNSKKKSDYSYGDFLADLENNKVLSVTITQNEEIPTGKITVGIAGSDSKRSTYVTDVKAVENAIIEYNAENTKPQVAYNIGDVERESIFLTTILPFIIVAAVIIFLFIFSISGSDFVEMFVGVGASRVRDLFEEAKKNAPCIVFIDEIDAVARRRGAGMGGGHDEREQTLNQMLVEMDGFGVNAGIIVMAATNRVDILDPAILRPGRFDRKVVVGRPDVKGRQEILEVHVKGKPIADDVNLETIAQTTAGFTGADLENLMNEAAIYAARNNAPYISQADIEKAFVKVGIGAEKKSKVISEKERRITAFHEAGHAILFHILPDVGPVHTISIIPTGTGAAGYTMPLPEKDEMFNTKGKMLQEIIVGLGGRVAEELIFDDVTTGASQDIKQSTQIARSMVTKYGFSDKVGLVNYGNDEDEVFIGRDLAHTRSYGENVAAVIDSEVKRIIDECYAKAKEIITENRAVLDRCAELLMKKEKVTREEFEAMFEMVL